MAHPSARGHDARAADGACARRLNGKRVESAAAIILGESFLA